MKVGLLITSIGNFGKKGFYNAQELGLAKELEKLVDEVVVYKLVHENQQKRTEALDGCTSVILHMIPSKSLGINGFFDLKLLDIDMDALVYFSDTQLMVPQVDKWARRNDVILFPYIGVLESHSTNKLIKKLIDVLFLQNVRVYRKRHCFAKTPDVEQHLKKLNVTDITVTPVGLDQTLLHERYADTPKPLLREKYGFSQTDKMILFIGRFVSEKQPERMIEIFKEVHQRNANYRLLMVGTGNLRQTTEKLAEDFGLRERVKFIDRIPNNDIWELYRLADFFVNLNRQEIFGMAILEAMYYECHVIAWKAPGPSYIIENGISGNLVNSNSEIVDLLTQCENNTRITETAHHRVEREFTWSSVARKMVDTIQRG